MTDDVQQKLNKQGIGMIAVLILEYLLGMFANLYVQFPEGKHGGQLWVFAWRQIPLALHIMIGLLLLIGSIVLLIRAVQYKNRRWIIASSISAIAIIGAIFAGAEFIPSQTAVYSFVMAISFIVAFLSYASGIYTSKT